jgi:hypothetical protein
LRESGFAVRDTNVQFLFADHTLDTDRRELRRGSEAIAMEPQVFDLLVYLVENRDRCASWPSWRRRHATMFLARRKPDHVARPDFFLGTAPALYPSETRCNDQCLTQRMGMPRGAGAWFERHACAKNARWCRCLEQRIDADSAGEISLDLFRTAANRFV